MSTCSQNAGHAASSAAATFHCRMEDNDEDGRYDDDIRKGDLYQPISKFYIQSYTLKASIFEYTGISRALYSKSQDLW